MSDSSEKITASDIAPTLLPDAFLQSDFAMAIRGFHMPRYQELPNVELYREQVIAYLDDVLKPFEAVFDGQIITPSMINNYVKLHVIAAPRKKLYNREHVARLICVCIFKQVVPIATVQQLFRIQRMTYPTEISYNYVAAELELALAAAFSSSGDTTPDTASRVTRESLLVRSMVAAFAAKTHLMGYVSYMGFDEAE